MKKLNIFLGLGALLFGIQLSAQITFSTPDKMAEPGQDVLVEVQVESFTEIVSAQFSIHWDPAVLQYSSVEDFILPTSMTTEFHFGATDVESGTLTFAWFDESLMGITQDDETVIFQVKFEVVGEAGR